jgi:hypothetical protein
MGKLMTVSGRTLQQSAPSHPGLTYVIKETDEKAAKCRIGGKEVLINQIKLQCDCSGDYVAQTSTFMGTGEAAIIADTKRVKYQGNSILLKGDKVQITCNGTITTTSSGATTQGTASVVVSIVAAGQKTVNAGNS